jgi:large repetitive protein
MRAARCDHSATLVEDGTGRVFVAGGSTNNGTTYLASTEYYNPTTNAWTRDSRDDMRNARARHAAVLLEGGDVLVTGGYNGRVYLTSAEQYRVDTPLTPWNPVGDLQVARADHTADLLPNGRVLVVGGLTAGEVATNTAEFCSNLVFCTWVRTTNVMDFARTGHATTVLENGDVLITGGFVNGVAAGSTEVFDNTRFSLTVNDMTTARARHAAVTLADGRVLVVGGVTGTSTPLDTVDFYERSTRRWSRGELGTLLAEARAGHTATVLPNGRVLVAGGDDRTRSLASAEVYSP